MNINKTISNASKEKSLYISIFYDLGFHARWKDASGAKMLSAPEELILMYVDKAKKEPIYRIKINDDGMIETTCYEMLDNFKPELNSFYGGVDELPKWVQDKLSVLMLLDPTLQNEEVETIGRRISENIFWVYKQGEDDGGNA
jgi:predicted CopG family antitoxin